MPGRLAGAWCIGGKREARDGCSRECRSDPAAGVEEVEEDVKQRKEREQETEKEVRIVIVMRRGAAYLCLSVVEYAVRDGR